MKLTVEGIKNQETWKKAGIVFPGYDVEKVSQKAKEEPGWVHFGIGNIFRVFIGGIADGLLEEGVLDRGITCVETFDYDVVDKIYAPYDNLGLSVILHGDGTREYKVLGSLAEAVKAQSSDQAQTAVAAIGIVAKKPDQFGKAMLFPAMVETYAILALLISILSVTAIQV